MAHGYGRGFDYGWSDFDLPAYIERSLGIPAIMDNDANAGALGEAVHGADVRGRLTTACADNFRVVLAY